MTSARKIKMAITVDDGKGNRRRVIVSVDRLITDLQIRVRHVEENQKAIIEEIGKLTKATEGIANLADGVVKELGVMKK